ncbi:alpha/beta fold hydrolase [Terasakiella pusilla]|uniref:alpha/beta fold hydrolase n=1 Tax=Terasakiella pusilla TaxID=64973 RepID=UPI003AA87956
MNAQNVIAKELSIETVHGPLAVTYWDPAVQSQKSPLIMFHDSLGAISLWRQFPALLALKTGRRVIAYDRFGFGKSAIRTDKLSADFVPQEPALVLPILKEEFGFSNFIAMGHSVGGAMAIEAAAQFPNDCASLVTIAAQTFAEDVTLNGIREAKKLFADPAQLQRLEKYHGPRTEWVVSAWIDTWLSDEFQQWTLNDALPKIICPALVIHGSDDEYGSTIHTDIISKKTSGPVTVEILQGGHHMPHRESEDFVLTLIEEFLA